LKKHFSIHLLVALLLSPSVFAQQKAIQIAFLADVHFQDLYEFVISDNGSTLNQKLHLAILLLIISKVIWSINILCQKR